jgi:hypothetical protein
VGQFSKSVSLDPFYERQVVVYLFRRDIMTRVEQLEQQIVQLDPDEFAQLREWLLEQDWAEWDRQIERDGASGKLDRLMKRALADHAAGKSRLL